MKHLKNKKWFSLIFAMGIVLAISLTTIYLLEYVIPFAKDTKGIEFSTNAYYQSSSAVENALLAIRNEDLWWEPTNPPEITTSTATNYGYDIVARWDTIPPAWEGTSEYDSNWNTLSVSKPLQIEIWKDTWDNAEIQVRVPNTGAWEGISLLGQTWGIVTWQLSSLNDTLISQDESDRIGNDLLKSWSAKPFTIGWKWGVQLEWGTSTFNNFYSSQCTTEKCTLKLSIINKLILDNTEETPIPFIEYRIISLDEAPLRYTRINTEGYSTGFKKDINIQIPQQTVNEAFDFTIFQ